MAKASDFEGKKPEELFYFVDYSPEEAERIGYSNYSYWGSVIQNFFKQKVAVFCLIGNAHTTSQIKSGLNVPCSSSSCRTDTYCSRKAEEHCDDGSQNQD